MYLSVTSKSFFRSVMVFTSGIVLGSLLTVGSLYAYITYFSNFPMLDNYLTQHHFLTRKDYLSMMSLLMSQKERILRLDTEVKGIRTEFVNGLRQLPLRSPEPNDERVSEKYNSPDGSAPMIASSNMSPVEKKQQQCAIWIVSYSSNPSPALLKKIDSQCK